MADHPIGFRKHYVPLTRRRVRLHIWPPGRHRSEDPHNHRWNFVAVPLWGRFRDTRWLVRPGKDWAHRWVVPDRGLGRLAVEDGYDDLLKVADKTRWPLVPYRCKVGEIHGYGPLGRGWHVSVVIMGRTVAGESEVWTKSEELSR